MAVETFPVALTSFYDLMNFQSSVFQLGTQDQASSIGSGEWVTQRLGPDLWRARYSTVPMTLPAMTGIQTWLNLVQSRNTLMLANPAAHYPQSDLDGTTLGASSVTVLAINADARRMSFTGLPVGYVLTAGDFVQINYSSGARTALHQLVQGATANGSGATSQIEVRPIIRPGVAAADPVTLVKPAMKAKVAPGSIAIEPVSQIHQRISFEALQTLSDD